MQTQMIGRQAQLAAGLFLLAVGAGARPMHGGHGPKVVGTKAMVLAGQIGGTWTQPREAAAGTTCQLSGNGNIGPLGPVQAEGSILTPGAVAHGRTTGTVTLTSAQGTLTLGLSGAAVRSGPTRLTYTIAGSTGAFAGQTGAGPARLTLIPQRRPTTIPGRMTPHYIVAPVFTLTFGSAPMSSTGPSHG